MTTILSCPGCGDKNIQETFFRIDCTTVKCRNYNAVWAKESLTAKGPCFSQPTNESSNQYKFLGCFIVGENHYDLHHYTGVTNKEFLLARYSSNDKDCYWERLNPSTNDQTHGKWGSLGSVRIPPLVLVALSEARKRLGNV